MNAAQIVAKVDALIVTRGARFRHSHKERTRTVPTVKLAPWSIPRVAAMPTALVNHGCCGVWSGRPQSESLLDGFDEDESRGPQNHEFTGPSSIGGIRTVLAILAV